jgi:hypothetical protein
MGSIGSFGAAVRELDPAAERDTFEFFDRKFTIHGVIPPFVAIHLGAAMTGKIGDIEGNAAMFEALRCALTKPADGNGEGADDAEFDRFCRMAVDRRCTTGELIKLVFSLLGAQADLPTEQQPTSQDGPLPTSESSNSSSSNTQDSSQLVSVEDRLAGLS